MLKFKITYTTKLTKSNKVLDFSANTNEEAKDIFESWKESNPIQAKLIQIEQFMLSFSNRAFEREIVIA